MKTGKHVIFLGAGASHSSGYPLANGLRLLISSEKKWRQALAQYEKNHGFIDQRLTSSGMDYWKKHHNVLNLFRNGGFATLDEFCKLAGGFQFQEEIHGLRCLVRAALGLFNPEENFEKSEYYGFVQSLFKDDLMRLREDITVLTYNYDPYLEYLLYRALDHRWKVSRKGKGPLLNEQEQIRHVEYSNALNAVTSGFTVPGNLPWLESDKSKPNFCVLKLHGSICYYADDVSGYDKLFLTEPYERAQKLFGANADSVLPPILFPWEIMTDKGFVEKDSFPFQNSPALYPLFRGIWERARREIQAADKISFVGMSMHSFLFDGLKYLFDGKENKVEICVANRDNTAFVPGKSDTHWNNLTNSPAYAVGQILSKVAPKMGRWGKVPGMNRSDGDITLVKDFEEFVRTQMKTVVVN